MKAYPEYKASGIDWIGEIPSHWKLSKLKYYVNISNGCDPKSEGDTPVYGSGGKSFKSCGEFKEGPTVLLGRKGTISSPRWVEGKYWNVDTAFDTQMLNQFNIRYFYYMAVIFDYDKYQTNTAVPSMTQSDYGGFIIPIPTIAEQQAIAAYLDEKTAKIDALIAEKKKQVEDLGAYRTSVITEAVTRGLNPNAPLRPSGIDWLGDIPTEWHLIQLRNLTSKIGSGVTPRGGSEAYLEKGILFIRSQNVYNVGLRLDDPVYISEEIDNSMSNTRVQENDILLNITGASIGRCCRYTLKEPANVNQHVCIIRVTDRISSKYLHYVLNSDIGVTQINLYQTGGNREGLNFEQLKSFTIPVPSLSEQQAIANYLDEKTAKIDELINELNLQIDELAKYKQVVISEAVTGKVDVRNYKSKH